MEDLLTQAARFINTTSRHLFLTGKAGTGKTTFLKNLKMVTHKNFIVVAPTGIAALQAGGVTIHSQFLVPPGTFLPDRFLTGDITEQGRVLTQNTLARKHPLNSARKLVLRSIDLLVIDEVSMLRADLLDIIDYRMKAARSNFRESFGGAQVLFIGDLFQLPPVVRAEEQELLSRYYKSPWFYEAHALRNQHLVYIELQKIFRQHDVEFINLLNHLRNNEVSAADIALLNRHHQTTAEIQAQKEVITLTTHNAKADEINRKELAALQTAAHTFDAFIEGEFPESMFPAVASLELKVGAQIMFIRNDASEDKKYVNGKLATVLEIEEDTIWVTLADTHERYRLRRARWENKRYSMETASQVIHEEVIGAFEQYPVKLAWAITVHKSQGLTFDRAIIDVEQAFAGGQVYVALSRLRSLEGLILRTRIQPAAISTDQQVVAFADAQHRPEKLNQLAVEAQHHYVRQLIQSTFDFSMFLKDIRYAMTQHEPEPDVAGAKPVLAQVAEAIESEKANTEKFRRQLDALLSDRASAAFLERIQKGSAYYRTLLTGLLEKLLLHAENTRQRKRTKTYLNHLTELDLALGKKLEELDKARVLTGGILEGHHHFDFEETARLRKEERAMLMTRARNCVVPAVVGKRKKSPSDNRKSKPGVPNTHEVTLRMFASGLTPEQIGRERSLTVATIETHLAKAIEAGQLELETLVSTADQVEIAAARSQLAEDSGLKDLYDALGGRYSYSKLRAVLKYRKPD